MKPTPCKPLPKGHRNTRNRKVIEQFIQSGERTLLIDGKKYRDAVSCLQSMRESIKRHEYTNVEAHMRDKRIYLVRNDMEDNKNEQS